MNKRFLEALAGALAGGVYGVGSAVATEPSARKRNKEMARKGVTYAAIGGVATPALNALLLKNLGKIRALASKSKEQGVKTIHPENHFMGGLRATLQELKPRHIEKQADYSFNNKKPFAAPALALEIQKQLRSDAMNDEEVEELVSDFSSKMGDPGNVVINRGENVYGGKYVDYSGKGHKSLNTLNLQQGGNVVSEPLRTLLVNTMAHGIDPDKDKTMRRVKNLDIARKGLIASAFATNIVKFAPSALSGLATVQTVTGKTAPPSLLSVLSALSSPKVNTARKIAKGLLAGGALAAHVARSHELYKANQRANEVVKNYYGMTDEDIENDPVLYEKLKKHYAERNMKVMSGIGKEIGRYVPDIIPDIPEEE